VAAGQVTGVCRAHQRRVRLVHAIASFWLRVPLTRS
jgi:hypothetical protein